MICSKLVRRSFCDQQNKEYCTWTYVINDLNGEETVRTFYEKRIAEN